MNLLLDGAYLPATGEVGFLECDVRSAVKAFLAWQNPIQGSRGVSLLANQVDGGLPEALEKLFPLTSVEARRFLFSSTESKWTAYFDNSWPSPEIATPISYLSRTIGCRGVRVACVPNTVTKDTQDGKGQYGALIFELFGPNATDFLNRERSIYLVNDGGRWTFGADGVAQDFEDTGSYSARKATDRFSFALLKNYLEKLGIASFDASFYKTEEAWLISKNGPQAKLLKEYSLRSE